MKYREETANKWIQPRRKDYLAMCCDCGLVHEFDFRLHKRHIQFRVRRSERRTAAARRMLAKEKS